MLGCTEKAVKVFVNWKLFLKFWIECGNVRISISFCCCQCLCRENEPLLLALDFHCFLYKKWWEIRFVFLHLINVSGYGRTIFNLSTSEWCCLQLKPQYIKNGFCQLYLANTYTHSIPFMTFFFSLNIINF